MNLWITLASAYTAGVLGSMARVLLGFDCYLSVTILLSSPEHNFKYQLFLASLTS